MAENNTIQLNVPKPFNPNKNRISEDWRVWKNEFLIYLELTRANLKLSEKRKAYLLLNLMGTEGVRAKDNMTFNDLNEEENVDILLKKFDETYDPPLNEIEERYKFFSRRKHDRESLNDYIADLKKKASNCNFGNQIEKFIIDMIILNMDDCLQHIAFTLNDLSLPVIIKFYNKHLSCDEKVREIYLDKLKISNAENIKDPDSLNNLASTSKERGNEESKNTFKSFKSKLFNLKDEGDHVSEKTNNISNSTVNKNNEKLNNSLYKQNETYVNKFKDCAWCESRHLPGQCKHDESCRRCDLFPHKICFQCKRNPHDDNCYYKTVISLPTESASKAGPLCSKCETNHVVFTRCPAYNVTCVNCFEKGHYTSMCKKKNMDEETANLSKHAGNKTNEESRPTADRLIYCLWCESRHIQNRCPHDTNCANCHIFPHNICFNCKKNPHDVGCYFKTFVSLPVKKESQADLNCSKLLHVEQKSTEHSNKNNKHQYKKSATPTDNCEPKTKLPCSRCGSHHPYMQCPAQNERCSSCNLMGHYESKCRRQPTTRTLEDCPLCRLRRLQHINQSRYYCYSCSKSIEIADSDDYDSNSAEVGEAENRQRSKRRRRSRKNHHKQEESACTIS